MKIRRALRDAAMAAVGITLAAAHADAGVITGINQFLLPGFSTGSMTAPATPSPNNDNASGASANTIATGGFGIFLNAGGFGFLDYEFNVADSGGTSEYQFTTNVLNNTGITWDGFQFQLGFGTGASFVPVGASSGLDFDIPDATSSPFSSVFTALSHQENLVQWSGGTVNYAGGPGGAPFSVAFSLAIDVPDGLAALHPGGVSRFTLRSFPTAAPVPEPATAAVLALGLAGLAWRRRRG